MLDFHFSCFTYFTNWSPLSNSFLKRLKLAAPGESKTISPFLAIWEDCLTASSIELTEIISIEDVIEVLGVKLIGIIPENFKIIIASNVGKPIPFGKDKELSSIFTNIAKRVVGEKIPVRLESEGLSKSENLWNKVKKTFNRI